MKKDRNMFFNESSYINQVGFPNQNFNQMNIPNVTSSYSNNGFYAGPLNNVPLNYTTPTPGNPNNIDYNDIESRLSKMERQLNRLDIRLNKLETNSLYTTDDIDNTTNVYMV